ncbi:hypothetical protein [Desulfovibrio sp. JC022]|uniref:hypothetical protein n=1 Tax=Desulfovibrio sp. JC022 TaxID=2593642 RepID=UPI0013D2A816|nr:hypothetical protein [Desulfovibrio sp. JC022]NDV22604.1 hypothetical protein [Desulfovibrio sp. JC022]
MQNKKYILAFKLILILTIMVIAGCKSTKRMVYAEYIMPPKVISDVSKIQQLKIDKPKIQIKTSGLSKRSSREISDIFTHIIVNDFSSKLYYNGYIKTTDELCGAQAGLKQVRKKLARSKHGYNVKITPFHKTAKLKVEARINYVRSKGTDRIQTRLTTQNYSVAYSDKGVPYAKASSSKSRTVFSNVPYIEVKAKGVLICTLYDINGKKVYSRVFDDLEFENKSGGDSGSKAEAPYPEVAQKLLNDAITKVVSDISPHKEKKPLAVNEKGDPTIVALIKGTAFFDARNRLEELLTEAEENIEKSSAEVNAEYDQLIAVESDPEKRLALEQQRAEDLIDCTRDYSPDYENLAIIQEVVGNKNEALHYYQVAVNADPENLTALDSVQRIGDMLKSSLKVSDPNKIDNYIQKKFKEN